MMNFVVNLMNFPLNNAGFETDLAFSEMDLDGGGTIGFEEFQLWMESDSEIASKVRQNAAICIYNEEFCIKNEEICIENDDWNTPRCGRRQPRRQRWRAVNQGF